MKLQRFEQLTSDGKPDGFTCMIYCPGCKRAHTFNTERTGRPCWTFNGDMERPTFNPSLKVTCSTWQNIQQDQWMPIMRPRHGGRALVRVPFVMLDEKHAQRLHQQSLARLAERGGLSACEALCHLDRVGLWDRQPADNDEETLANLVRSWLDEHCPPAVCHSFVRDGRIEFLGDCTHSLAGQTVDLPDIPEDQRW